MIPDIWIEQGPQKDQYDIAGLNEALQLRLRRRSIPYVNTNKECYGR